METKWYFKTYWLVIAFLCFGPLALLLFWFNPRYAWVTKIVVTVIIILLSYYSGVLLAKYMQSASNYYQGIF